MFMAQHSGVLPSLITGARGPERTFVDGAANDSSEPQAVVSCGQHQRPVPALEAELLAKLSSLKV